MRKFIIMLMLVVSIFSFVVVPGYASSARFFILINHIVFSSSASPDDAIWWDASEDQVLWDASSDVVLWD